MLVTNAGKLIRVPIDDVRIAGRNTQGVRIFKTEESEKVVSVERVPEDGNGSAANGDGAVENGETGGEPGA
jgi:DNA gyrase subunit A